MAAELKVGIGVDATGLDTGLDKAQSQLKGFGKTVNTETKRVGASFQGMSRVLQDAAFGPGAIANNLAALGDDFKQLSQAAKDSGQSIGKTLVQSLAGPGGLNLAMGALTLGLSLASFGLSAWTRMFGDSNKEVKKGTDELKQYVESLDAVNESRIKGTQNAQSELVDLKALFTAYQNANLPLEARKSAYEQLQQQYPDYFKNIEFEEKASKRTKDAYNALTASILATAQARAFNNKITKNTEEQLVVEEKLATLLPKILQARADEARLAEAAFKATRLTGPRGEAQAAIALDRSNAAREHRNDLEQEFFNLTKQQRGIISENAQLANRVQQLLGQGAEIVDVTTTNTEDAAKRIKDIPNYLKPLTLKVPKIIVPKVQVPQALIDFNTQLQEGFDQINLSAIAFTVELNEIIRAGSEQAFGSLGEALGQAIVSGENLFGALGQSILGSLGDILVQFGKLTIKAGVASSALAFALGNPLNPASGPLAIAAGAALVAIGTAVKGFSKGIGSGGGKGGVPRSAPEAYNATAPSGFAAAGIQQSQQFEFVIRGQDLVTATKRASTLNSRQGVI